MPGSSGGFRVDERAPGSAPSASGSSSPGGAADTDGCLGQQALVAYDGAVAPGDVGDLHAVVTTAVLGVQLVDLRQRRRALGVLHRGDVGDRPRQVGERGRGVRLPDAELLLVDEAEVRRLHQRRREAFLVGRRDQPLEPLHPRDALVVGVPGECERAAGPQDPGDLRQGHLVVEPVEGLSAHDDVDRTRADGDGLGGGHHMRDVDALGEDVEHLRKRVGRQHVVPGAVQDLGQLAGSGTELEHHRATRSGHPADGLVGVRRARSVVDIGHRAERPFRGWFLRAHRALEVTR